MTTAEARRRRVLLVSCSTLHGGAERSMLALAERLPTVGIDAVVACPPGGLADAARAAGVPVAERRLTAPGRVRGRSGRYSGVAAARYVTRNLRNTWELVRTVRSVRPDVLHSNSLPTHLATAVAGRLTRRPVGWHLREIVQAGPGRRMLSRYGRWAGELVAISQAVAAAVDHPHVHVVMNPVARPAEVQPRLPVDVAGQVVGFLGRVEPHKGVVELVEAMAGNTAQLVVMGPASDPAYLQRVEAAAARSAAGRVHLVGPVPDPWAALGALDVLVVPSHAEPFGRVAAEAQLMGTAVLAADSGGLPEIVTDGEDGLLFRTGDADHLTTQLARLLDDDALRRRLGATGAQTAVRFAPARHAEQMAVVLRRLAGDAEQPVTSPVPGRPPG